jgi:hypothetical protein
MLTFDTAYKIQPFVHAKINCVFYTNFKNRQIKATRNLIS